MGQHWWGKALRMATLATCVTVSAVDALGQGGVQMDRQALEALYDSAGGKTGSTASTGRRQSDWVCGRA